MKGEIDRQLQLLEIYTKEIEENYNDEMFDVEFWTNEIYEVIHYLKRISDETYERIKNNRL